MQIDKVGEREKEFKSSLDCARMQVKRHGIFNGWYRGGVPNTLREMVFCAVYFTIYERLKSELLRRFEYGAGDMGKQAAADGLSHLPILLAGGVSGASSWFVSFPMDVIKSKKQQSAAYGKSNVTMWAIAKDVYRAQGLQGFYRGLGTSLFRAFIVSSTRFETFEIALAYLKSDR